MHCGSSSIAPLSAVVVILLAAIYSLGWFRLRTVLPDSEWRLSAFLVGLGSVAGVWATPLANLDHRSLIWHMVQHLVLMTVTAPLILLGNPLLVLEHAFPRNPTLRMYELLVRSALIRRLKSTLANPIFCWSAGTGCVILWHIPAIFELGMRLEWWHDFEQFTFLAAGILFWLPVVQQPRACKPHWGSTALYLFLATLPCDVLSAFLAFCGRVVYSSYRLGGPASDNLALLDQELAGVTMWVWVTFAYLAPALIVTVQGLSARPTPSARVPHHTTPVQIGRGSL